MAKKASTTLSSKYQISIPKEVREKQGWKPGQKFAFIPSGKSRYVMVAVPTVEDLRAKFRGASTEFERDRNDRA